MKIPKALYEDFAKFAEKPTRNTFKALLTRNFGEHDQVDFKAEWIPDAKLAKHIIAMANSGGGAIVFGVEQPSTSLLVAVGLSETRDKADVDKKLRPYLPAQLVYEVIDLVFEENDAEAVKGKKFQVVLVEYVPSYIPFLPLKDNTTEHLYKTRIYVRKGTNSEEADYAEIQQLLNYRIATNQSTTREFTILEHLEQLKSLYREINPTLTIFEAFTPKNNPHYPKEGYEEFVARLIEEKKGQIVELLRDGGT